MGKALIGFVLGAVVGIAGFMLSQQPAAREANKQDAGPSPGVVASISDKAASLEQQLEFSNAERTRLEAELAALRKQVAAVEEPAGGEDKGFGESIFEMMMEMGNAQAKRQVDAQVGILSKRLGLSDAQEDVVRAALLGKLERQRAAGEKVMKGEASIADLAAADEDDFSAFDEAVIAQLSAEQKEEFTSYQQERESRRVEKKATKDLDGLREIASLTSDQQDRAWDLFVSLNAEDKPGRVPEGTTPDDFERLIDESINKRIDGLQPILDSQQLADYQVQTESFREMVLKIMNRGTGRTVEE